MLGCHVVWLVLWILHHDSLVITKIHLGKSIILWCKGLLSSLRIVIIDKFWWHFKNHILVKRSRIFDWYLNILFYFFFYHSVARPFFVFIEISNRTELIWQFRRHVQTSTSRSAKHRTSRLQIEVTLITRIFLIKSGQISVSSCKISLTLSETTYICLFTTLGCLIIVVIAKCATLIVLKICQNDWLKNDFVTHHTCGCHRSHRCYRYHVDIVIGVVSFNEERNSVHFCNFGRVIIHRNVLLHSIELLCQIVNFDRWLLLRLKRVLFFEILWIETFNLILISVIFPQYCKDVLSSC